MSPLIFILVMEYLTRVLLYQSKFCGLKFHPSCKPLLLNSLCFADDLILLSKADSGSFDALLRGLQLFLDATDLCINQNKSCLYVCGVDEDTKRNMLQLAGVIEGVFPMNYLGVPLKPTKWNQYDCAKVVDKISGLISCWGKGGSN